jgi:hypothetical protein
MPETMPDLGIVRVERVTRIELALSAWEVCVVRWPSPAEVVTCAWWLRMPRPPVIDPCWPR